MVEPTSIHLQDVSIRYGTLLAVDRLTLTVGAGEILGLLGPNGSGKSSTLAAIAGLRSVAAGTINVEGICRQKQRTAYAQKIGFVPQTPALFDELSVHDNLDYFGSLFQIPGRQRRQRIAIILERIGLSGRTGDRVGALSGGMKQRLNFGIALVHEPAVLLLDEPTVAMDPVSREMLFAVLRECRAAGRTIIFTTHQLEEAEQACDRVCVLRSGRQVALGRPADVLHAGRESAVIHGVLRQEIDSRIETDLRLRLAAKARLNLDGRCFRLLAENDEELTLALAVIAANGLQFESLRTPPGRFPVDASGPQVTAAEEARCSAA